MPVTWRELVVVAKLTAPNSSAAVVRERLEERLLAGLRAGVVLVMAGGGSGKSTLVSHVVHRRRIPHLWYQLDDLDVSVRPFFAHLTVGLQRLCPDLPLRGPGALADQSRWQDPGQLLAAFLWDWEHCGASLGRPPLLVLDDIHHLTAAPALRQVVRRLIAYLPAGAAVALLGRRDPGLGLARLEHLDRVVRLSGRDLAFTPGEARELLEQATGRSVSEAEAEKACSLVQGWALGLMYLTRRPAKRLSRETPLDRYLAEETLLEEPPAAQRLLLAASLLSTVNPRSLTAVAAALFPPVEAEPAERRLKANTAILRDLAGRHWYLNRLPGGESYRLHDLVGEFLHQRLVRQLGPDAVARGYAAAARDALAAGRIEEALAQALAGENPELGVQCLRQTGPLGWDAADPERWLLFMDRLRQLGATSPWVDFAEGHAYWQAGEVERALQAYQRAAAGFAADGELAGRGMVLVEQLRAYAYRGDHVRTEELAAEALQLLPPGALRERARVSDSRALAAHLAGHPAAARAFLQESLELYRQAGDRDGESSVLNNLVAVYYLPRGDLFRALQNFERAHYLIRLSGRRLRRDLQGQLTILANIGLMRTLLGQHTEAEATLRRAVRRAQEHGFRRVEALATTFLGQLLTCTHRFPGARAALDRAMQIQQEVQEPLRTAAVYYQLGELALESGDAEAAVVYAQQDLERVLPLGSALSEAESRLFLARTLAAAGHRSAALQEAERVEELEERLAAMGLGSPLRRIHLRLVQAQALGGAPGEPLPPQARALLAEALQQTSLHGYESVLYNSRASLSGLLAVALQHQVAPEVTTALLSEWRRWDPTAVAALESQLRGAEEAAGPSVAAAAAARPQATPGQPGLPWEAGTPGEPEVPGQAEARNAGGPAPSLRVELLGDFRLEVNGREVPANLWPRRRVKQLFQYLILRHGRWVPVGDLIEALWPDLADRSVSGSFHVALHALRRVLEPSLGRGRQSRFIETQRGLCRIAPGVAVALDVSQFEAACRTAEIAWEAGDTSAARSAWEAAVSLYRGPFLAGDRQSEWTGPPRESLHQQYVHALLGLSRIAAGDGRAAAALTTTRQALAVDPYSEEACALAMTLLAEAGRVGEALRLYRDFRDRLQSELDATPMPHLAALAAELSTRVEST